ncbi:M24 family metallopeptidase [Agrobacterium rosae]|uniref:M24 family metallopeptidase n=1 Tax=Agrobacterium rosae TaxID=1972867 RepID=UPI00122EE1E5|nr:Xaa-Pro peptidase family protein [Agrobacterium rosae]KAA3511573.1 aminopeptidase P family protein [Agrobacterium rosae]KAA3519002.1 aminopeptidase P family protein [Agrobacterium rosae]MQB49266.1 aminopeptidase P family protein [Agrobacterium rosae]
MFLGTKPAPIGNAERFERLERLRAKMAKQDIAALLLGSTESLRYFTGLVWHQSERLLGAVVTPTDLHYIVPGFEKSRVDTLPHIDGDIHIWQEEQHPATLVGSLVGRQGRVALDEGLPLFIYHSLVRELGQDRLIDGGPLVSGLRIQKSQSEIAIIQYELGGEGGSYFCIVSFGKATSLPHGADGDQTLQDGDVILVDTGTRIDGYHSDITRTYVLENPAADFAQAWAIEREAQQAVFDAAELGAPCSSLDDAARNVLIKHGLGPDYALPGLPHRAGHGLGLEIHEEPYIVRGNSLPLAQGMCFSNEPMLVYPDRFGIRLEDHIYMSSEGANWFTQPAKSPTEPFS